MSWFHDLPCQTSRYPQGSIFFKMYLFKFFVLPLFTELQGLQTTHCVLNYIFPKNQVILIYVQFVKGQANIEYRANRVLSILPSHSTPYLRPIFMLYCALHYLLFRWSILPLISESSGDMSSFIFRLKEIILINLWIKREETKCHLSIHCNINASG